MLPHGRRWTGKGARRRRPSRPLESAESGGTGRAELGRAVPTSTGPSRRSAHSRRTACLYYRRPIWGVKVPIRSCPETVGCGNEARPASRSGPTDGGVEEGLIPASPDPLFGNCFRGRAADPWFGARSEWGASRTRYASAREMHGLAGTGWIRGENAMGSPTATRCFNSLSCQHLSTALPSATFCRM